MATPDRAFVQSVRAALRPVGDPQRAQAMQTYMKSAMPYYGVTSPVRVRCLRPVLAAYDASDRATWEATVRALYDEAEFREERYAALDLLAIRVARTWHDPDLVDLLAHLVRVGAWWDLVDEVAGHHVAPTHRAHPLELSGVLRQWASDDDLWLRRAAVLSQLGSKGGTDRQLLADVIEANARRPEFWLRKAIGWALRDLSPHDPAWVTAFVAAHPELSPLSRREALRRIPGALEQPGGTAAPPRDGVRGPWVASDITGE